MTKFENIMTYVYVAAYFLALLLEDFGVLSAEATPLVIKTVSGLLGVFFLYSFVRHYIKERKVVYMSLYILLVTVAIFIVY